MELSGQLHAPAAFARGKELPDTHWAAGRVIPRTVLDIWEKRKISSPAGIQTPNHPACSPVTIPTTLPHLLNYTLSQFKTIHIPIAQRPNLLVSSYVRSLFWNTNRQKNVCASLCVMDRERDGHKLPVITLGPSEGSKIQHSTFHKYTWCKERATIWNDAHFN